MKLYLSQGLMLLGGVFLIALCGLVLYLWFALVEVNRILVRRPRLPQVPRDGSGRRIKERL